MWNWKSMTQISVTRLLFVVLTKKERTKKRQLYEKTNNGFSSVHVALSKGMERKPFSNKKKKKKKKKKKSTDQKTVRADDMCVYVLLKVMERNNKAFFFF